MEEAGEIREFRMRRTLVDIFMEEELNKKCQI